jgi:hypothetical protein
MAAEKNKGGRPLKNVGEPLSETMSFRIRPRLAELLRAAAAEASRTVSAEAEHRIERSFLEDRRVGGDVGSEVLRLIQLAMSIEGASGGAWSEDPASAQTVRAVADAIIAVLANLPLDPPMPEQKTAGLQLAKQLLLRSSKKRELPPELEPAAEEKKQPASKPRKVGT